MNAPNQGISKLDRGCTLLQFRERTEAQELCTKEIYNFFFAEQSSELVGLNLTERLSCFFPESRTCWSVIDPVVLFEITTPSCRVQAEPYSSTS
jgi:hypothetical protein